MLHIVTTASVYSRRTKQLMGDLTVREAITLANKLQNKHSTPDRITYDVVYSYDDGYVATIACDEAYINAVLCGIIND